MTDASPTADRRLLLVHAHPDDETIMTGGTIARYLAEGVDVRVLTFTLGEEGEVIGDEFAQLVSDGGADQLGGYRIAELTRALAALSPADGPALTPRFLGGAGRWRDSGMAGAPSADHPRALVRAPFDEPVGVLFDLLLGFAPQVVVSYDASGTYGHPDHKLVHEVTAAAVARAREAGAGPAKLYESVTERSALENGLAAARAVPDGWRMPRPGELPSYPDDRITTEVDVRAYYSHKVAGLAAHATQVTVAPSGTEYALSNNILQPIHDHEHFILTDHDPREAPGGDRETDLFAGIG
ncbi:N-acetyl-1-D-myo-inositol-2-amino-2-deoxy-alpha-D-glucopyranoside deacetylase [Gordonia sp. Swx-4]|uniref:N-acetyl-1-D-myo-inositol-2-amino-2-deoxy-alpha- D-glucopyranoside deacetylase n=1 Tax=Gordonia TaxID=2053 RepID=UPI000FDD33E4|nr:MULTISPECIES: N-acetyl-1-D-myo-inositol-2-amino-2-deoxy-alpha-D-glucopyranoside deacetylase [Gordonia]AZZ81510.1 N-acetyl-1-D-myo-inositol-2-amino-2-deoxy-alpha-D-glucopyranoside deacetylase [Gordonia alkanivorans]WJG12277.1 N-acetyl-1-D-myo-inositol-2-amino-2-deoxy-alpha-D-glucopyranoside deacetylase [Gordonia sp. Swx-4]